MSLLIFVRVFLVMNGIFRVGRLFTVAQNICSSHKDCNSVFVCCKSSSSTEFRCRKPFNATSTTQSCFGSYCTNTSDCLGFKDGKKLCCRSNRCALCPRCLTHSDCGQSRLCCARAWYEESQCSYTCVGKSCRASSDCAARECCQSGRCVKCSDRGCAAHKECPTGQYCCDRRNYRKGKCKWNCIGETCASDKDCALSEHCSSNKCRHFIKCKSNANCGNGSYCCKLNWYKHAVCTRSCIGNPCIHDNDCGPSDECCLNDRCLKCGDSCTSTSDCFSEAICCKGALFGENKCASKCDEESCILNSDCVLPGTWCVAGTCTRTKQCNFTSDCITPADKKYQCCIDDNSGLKLCSKSCAARQCISDRDCASTECCGSDGMCTTKSECAWMFPYWLIGVFVAIVILIVVAIIFAYYSRRKMLRQLNRRQSARNAAQNTVFSGVERERAQNIYHDPPNERPVQPNIRLLVSRPEVQEQVYYPLSSVSNNEFIEMVELPPGPHLENEMNNRGESRTSPSSSEPNNPSASSSNNIRRTDNPNTPPPYSFDRRPTVWQPRI